MAIAVRPARADVPESLTWNLHDIYATDDLWEADLGRVPADLQAVTAFRGRLAEGAGTAAACLRARDALQERLTRIGAYASLHGSSDGTSPRYQAMGARVGALAAQVGSELAFIASELLQLPAATLDAYLQAPELAIYHKQLADIARRRPHSLEPATEAALAALGEALQVPATVYRRVIAADLDFPSVRDAAGQEVQMSVGRYQRLAGSPDREVRRRAHEALVAGLRRHQTTLATTLGAMIRRNVALARLRHYESAEEMILDPQGVPLAVYTNVLDVIHDAIAPHMRRLLRLRQRLAGIDRMRAYDLNAPLDPEFNPSASFEDAERLIRTALAPLGTEYDGILADAFAHRWVDRADNVGKSHGAFCSGVYGVHSYVSMTWTDGMRNVFTLAHELGHAGHGMLASRNQVISNTRSTRFFVEAPSTANELLLGRYLRGTTEDPRMRRWLVMQSLGTFVHNMVTHLLQGHLERRLYALAESGTPITLSAVMQAQAEVYDRFYDGAVEVDDGMRLDWMTVPHYYTGLYPFTYAAGLSCAFGVVDAIGREGQPAVDRWLATLRTGGTRPPLELMRMAGVDLTSPEPLRRAVGFFGELVAELEAAFGGAA